MGNQRTQKLTVLITGASSGIGYELAKLFAQDGYNIILVARSKTKLKVFAEELQKRFNIKAKIIAKDLSVETSAMVVYEELKALNMDIDVLVNNAGAGSCGLFHQIDYEKALDIITLNITSLTLLTKFIVTDMIKRGKGKILNVASTGAYQPGPYIAVYYASKAYVLSFSEALANELKAYGISVTILCPGATRTEFAWRAGKADLRNAMDAKEVARICYIGLNKKKRIVIPGIQNKIAVIMSKLLPGRITAEIAGKIQKSLTEKYNKIE